MPKTTIFFMPEGEGGGDGGGGDGEGGEGGEGGGGDGDGEKPKNLKEFAAKFSATRVNPMLTGRGPSQQDIDIAKANAERNNPTIVNDNDDEGLSEEEKAEKLKQAQAQLAAKKKGGSNVPKIVEDKRKAEQDRDTIKAEYEKYKTETETKIADLQKKIDSGDFSVAKEKEFQTKIVELEGKLQSETEALAKENQRIKTRLGYYDLAENDTFKKEYLEPIMESFQNATEALGTDPEKQELLNRAMSLNAYSLSAKSPEARRTAEVERDKVLSQLEESLPSFTGKRFSAAMGEYIHRAAKHAQALSQHEKTAVEIRNKAKQESTRAYSEVVSTWGKTYDATAKNYDEDVNLSKEDLEMAKELGIKIEDELKQASVKAKKSVTGQATMEESIQMVHQGRAYHAVKAKLQIRDKEIADLKAQIEKLRAGNTGGGGGGGGGGNGGKPTREDFHKRFSANRPEVARQGG